jgi:hypothetical protein
VEENVSRDESNKAAVDDVPSSKKFLRFNLSLFCYVIKQNDYYTPLERIMQESPQLLFLLHRSAGMACPGIGK